MIPLAAAQLASLSGPTAALVAGVLAALGLVVLAWRLPRLRGTTLVAPWFWSLVVLASWTAAEVAIALAPEPAPSWAMPLRFVATMSTFCPVMALLGAKRPQDRGWQVIVLTLWVTLSLPAIKWLLFGGVEEVHAARFWFLAILMLVGATNALGTRYWPSSLLFAAGQIVLLLPFFAERNWLPGAIGPLAGMATIVVAWLLETARLPRTRAADSPLDRVWLDFRDAFGVVWGLRIQERVNASAHMYDWPLVLTWRGFAPRDTAADLAVIVVPEAVEESLRTLLRRFVSPEWIDARVQSRAPTASAR